MLAQISLELGSEQKGKEAPGQEALPSLSQPFSGNKKGHNRMWEQMDSHKQHFYRVRLSAGGGRMGRCVVEGTARGIREGISYTRLGWVGWSHVSILETRVGEGGGPGAPKSQNTPTRPYFSPIPKPLGDQNPQSKCQIKYRTPVKSEFQINNK